MASPQRIERGGRTYWRVQIRKPAKGLRIDQHFPSKRAAERFIRRVEHNLDEGVAVAEAAQARESLAEAVAAYLADPDAFRTRGGRPLKPSYRRDRIDRLRFLARRHTLEIDGRRVVIDLGTAQLRRLTWQRIDHALSALAKARGWTPRTRYQYEVALSRLLAWAKARGIVTTNVVAGQDRYGGGGRRERIFTDDEWHRLLAAADPMLQTFLRLAWETGCRKSELLKLRWVDVTPLDDQALGAELSIRDTKNREDRTVFISAGTYSLLKDHRRRFPSDDKVFPPVRGWRVDEAFRTARAAAGLDQPDERHGEVLAIHSIRHTWATRLGASGATLAELMAAGGWKTAGMAVRYMKVQRQQAREAALKLVQR